MKPVAKRLQLQAYLEGGKRGENYDQDLQVPTMQIDSIALEGRPADLPTSFAVGSVRGDRLLLVPIDQAMQVCPLCQASPTAWSKPLNTKKPFYPKTLLKAH